MFFGSVLKVPMDRQEIQCTSYNSDFFKTSLDTQSTFFVVPAATVVIAVSAAAAAVLFVRFPIIINV